MAMQNPKVTFDTRTWEYKEDPSSYLVRLPQLLKVELPDRHGHGVLQRADKVPNNCFCPLIEATFSKYSCDFNCSPEVLQIILEDKVEEGCESDENDGELNGEGGETGEAEADGGSNL